MPCFGIIRSQKIPKQYPIVLELIVITCFGISDQFSYPVKEFMLKNDTLENGTSRIGLYESTPGGGGGGFIVLLHQTSFLR